MAHKFLEDNSNDLVGLAQILGHENLNTTARYTKRTEQQLGEASERLALLISIQRRDTIMSEEYDRTRNRNNGNPSF